ncbi:MAG: hypothetical protein AAF638_07525 [Pseudomonadota bacterium]
MIRFSIILSEAGRTTEARAAIAAWMARFGIEETAGGMATLSFACAPEAYAAAFGGKQTGEPHEETLRPRDAVGGGASALNSPATPIPDDLEPFVDHISVTPAARGFG